MLRSSRLLMTEPVVPGKCPGVHMVVLPLHAAYQRTSLEEVCHVDISAKYRQGLGAGAALDLRRTGAAGAVDHGRQK
jgi:hypothetical protein